MKNHSLLNAYFCIAFSVASFVQAASWGAGQHALAAESQKAKTGEASWIDPSVVRDAKAREAVSAIKAKLDPIKGYTASIVGSGFSPHGGLQPFPDEQWVRRPDRMLIKRKAASPYNSRLVMTIDVTIVIAGDQYLTKSAHVPLTPEQRKVYEEDYSAMMSGSGRWDHMTDAGKKEEIERNLKSQQQASYTKINLATVAKSVPEFSTRTVMANNNNLLDPFGAVKMESLKIVKETPETWVFQAEMKQDIPGIKAVRLTFDRRTGFLAKVQWEIDDMMGATETRTTLQVNKVMPMTELPDSRFKMEMPPENLGNLDGPRVSDDTERMIDDYRMSKEMEAEARKVRETQEKGAVKQK